MVVRNSGIIGPKVDVTSNITGASGVFDKFDQYMAKKGAEWPYGSSIYDFTSFTFTNPVRKPWGPTSSEVLAVSAYSSSTFASDTTLFQVVEGIQYWVVPETANYTITAKGPSGASHVSTNYFGSGGILRGTFSLSIGSIIAILVGSRPPVTSHGSTYTWQGGGGGTFVAVVPTWGDNTSSSAYPLVVAGGGSGNRSNNSTHRTYASANMSPNGKNGSGSNGGTQGAKSSSGGLNASGGGGSAGWNGNQLSHGDCRNVYTPTGYPQSSTCSIAYPGAKGFDSSSDPGQGGIFNTGWNTSYRGSGGFGGGGPGGWGGQGGAGGYSGGGNGSNNSTEYGGGGGSFINSSASSTAVSGATIGTSTGSWSSGSGAYSGHSILSSASGLTNLGYNSNADGAVTIEKGLI